MCDILAPHQRQQLLQKRNEVGRCIDPAMPALPRSECSQQAAVNEQAASRAKQLGEDWLAELSNADPVQGMPSCPLFEPFVEENLDLMREDVRELSNLQVIETFNMEDIQEFMNCEDELHIFEPVTESTAIEAAVQTAIEGEEDRN